MPCRPRPRTRIGPWPTLIADDLVALSHLEPSERRTVDGSFVHELPGRLREIYRAEIRREAGRLEFAEWAAETGQTLSEPAAGGRWLLDLAKQPALLPGVGLFVLVKGAAKIGARRHRRAGGVAWSSPDR